MLISGARLKQHRTARGLTKRSLASMCGITDAAIFRIEDGTTLRTRFMAELCAALNVTADMLHPKPESQRKVNPGLHFIMPDDAEV